MCAEHEGRKPDGGGRRFTQPLRLALVMRIVP